MMVIDISKRFIAVLAIMGVLSGIGGLIGVLVYKNRLKTELCESDGGHIKHVNCKIEQDCKIDEDDILSCLPSEHCDDVCEIK